MHLAEDKNAVEKLAAAVYRGGVRRSRSSGEPERRSAGSWCLGPVTLTRAWYRPGVGAEQGVGLPAGHGPGLVLRRQQSRHESAGPDHPGPDHGGGRSLTRAAARRGCAASASAASQAPRRRRAVWAPRTATWAARKETAADSCDIPPPMVVTECIGCGSSRQAPPGDGFKARDPRQWRERIAVHHADAASAGRLAGPDRDLARRVDPVQGDADGCLALEMD